MNTQNEATRGRIAFEPGLEGLRGAALLGTLCYHAQFSWAQGGFLAIATFFTLSGYLITSLLVSEWNTSERIDLLSFWGRRFRRLMPAALLTLLLISVFGVFVATPSQIERLPGDVRWSLFYAANWHFLFSNASYTAMFEAPSPVQHFWSLGIEEQFYFVFPIFAAGALAIGKGSRRFMGGALAALVVASVAVTIALTLSGASVDRVYYGTDTRIAEILLGALAAVLIPSGSQWRPATQEWIQRAGAAALVAMGASWIWIDLNTEALYVGGLAAYSLLSATVITAAVQPTGLVRRLFSLRAIRWVGKVSYGAYLFHWPIFLTLSPERTGLDPAALFALRLFATLTLAELSHRWLETPIRSRSALNDWRAYAVAPLAFVAVWFAIAAVPKPESIFDVDVEAMDAFIETTMLGHVPPTNPPPPSLFNEAPRIAVFGDSTALTLGIGLQFLQSQAGTSRYSRGAAQLGCGIARDGSIRTGEWVHRNQRCKGFDVAWARAIREEQPDIALVLSAGWDIRDRQLPGESVWRSVGEPEFDRYLRDELIAATDTLAKDGSLVVWLTHPAINVHLFDKEPDVPYPSSDPARIARWNELIFELETLRPGKVRVIDLRNYIRGLPGGEMNKAYRPDGTHLTHEAAYQVARDWLANEILRVYREQAGLHR